MGDIVSLELKSEKTTNNTSLDFFDKFLTS